MALVQPAAWDRAGHSTSFPGSQPCRPFSNRLSCGHAAAAELSYRDAVCRAVRTKPLTVRPLQKRREGPQELQPPLPTTAFSHSGPPQLVCGLPDTAAMVGPKGWNHSQTIMDATQQGPAAVLDTVDPACLSTGPLGFTSVPAVGPVQPPALHHLLPTTVPWR